MPKITKYLPYLVIALDVFALMALQSIVACFGVNSEACQSSQDSPSALIVIIAFLVTGFYLFKRYKAGLPVLPFMSALKKGKNNSVASGPKVYTPLKNRLFFGFISWLLMMSYFVMVYHYTKGSDTPPYAHWSVFTLPLLAGLMLITLKDEIKLRMHPFWTPLGLLYAAFAWVIMIFVNIPHGSKLGYSLFDSIGEGFWFANGWGLMLAFVGLGPLYKRAFYFIPLAFFGGLFGSIELTNQIKWILIERKPVEWGVFHDLLWLAGGHFALCLIIGRLIKDRPPVKVMVKAAGWFALLIVLNTIISQNIISQFFPKNSMLHHWLRGYLPAYDFKCAGVECSNVVYREPYSFCVDGNPIDRRNPSPFYSVAQSRGTKGCRYELNSDRKSLKVLCSHPLDKANANTADLPVVECANSEYEGAYGNGLGGSQLRQKELYEK